MKRMMMKVILLVASFTFGLPIDAQAVTINIASDTTWTVSDSNETNLGNAQNVCLNETAPSNCPAGATVYGYRFSGWTANLSSIPGATWIWAPDITGATATASNAEFTFQKEFYLCGAPSGGTIYIAADNSAEVFLNGERMMAAANSMGHATLSSVPIPASKLVQGLNIIQVKVKNEPNPPGCISNLYQCNPAGLVFGASFADALTALPTCTSNGKTFTVGQFEPLTCPPGQTGERSRPCVCIGSNGVWGPTNSTCAQPPKTCTGNNGSIFGVGDTETLTCPPGQQGSTSHTCQANGSWGATSSTCIPPPKTCTGNSGTVFASGQTETLTCDAGQIGSASRTCLTDGTWGPTNNSACMLPTVDVGAVCGNINRTPPQFAMCPTGTECGSRRSPGTKAPPPWCILVLWIPPECRVSGPSEGTVTTDWYCDPL